mmetsp:Transcript_75663/g.202538  ORF Transcript_75663/g.202538 Transcript_75663/m.202538 type:complete len:81 (+) Transcript_75663:134-376(+)
MGRQVVRRLLSHVFETQEKTRSGAAVWNRRAAGFAPGGRRITVQGCMGYYKRCMAIVGGLYTTAIRHSPALEAPPFLLYL